LVATRDKNGVYVAEENYNDMVLRLEKNEVDICEKIATIRAVNEELNKKEVYIVILRGVWRVLDLKKYVKSSI